MPIGKNAIKRVANNGYSSVKSDAPDMENSVVVEEKSPVEEKKPTAKKTAPKPAPKKKAEPKTEAKPKTAPKPKTTAAKKPAPKKSMETEPELSPVKTAEKVVKKPAEESKQEDNGYINIGGVLPVHLL